MMTDTYTTLLDEIQRQYQEEEEKCKALEIALKKVSDYAKKLEEQLAGQNQKAADRIEELEMQLNNLLARIFRDGGQMANQLGDSALSTADQIIADLHASTDHYESLKTAHELERLQENLSLAECYISGEYWDNYMSKRK